VFVDIPSRFALVRTSVPVDMSRSTSRSRGVSEGTGPVTVRGIGAVCTIRDGWTKNAPFRE
jgi:hypothetical protein